MIDQLNIYGMTKLEVSIERIKQIEPRGGRTVEPNCHDTCEPCLIWKIEQAEYSRLVAEEMKKNTDMVYRVHLHGIRRNARNLLFNGKDSQISLSSWAALLTEVLARILFKECM